LAVLALVEVSFGLIYGRRGLRLLRNPRFWAFVLSAVAVGPFLIGEPDVTLGPLGLSREGLATGLEMAGRACTLTLAVGLRLFLITTVANTLRYGDDVVSAAAVRAFDPDGGSPARVPLRRADLWLVVMLLGCTGVIVAARMW
jgi:hypothetical protein